MYIIFSDYPPTFDTVSCEMIDNSELSQTAHF